MISAALLMAGKANAQYDCEIVGAKYVNGIQNENGFYSAGDTLSVVAAIGVPSLGGFEKDTVNFYWSNGASGQATSGDLLFELNGKYYYEIHVPSSQASGTSVNLILASPYAGVVWFEFEEN